MQKEKFKCAACIAKTYITQPKRRFALLAININEDQYQYRLFLKQ
jgi:hypothetical protein